MPKGNEMRFAPIADTMSGSQARTNPDQAIEHYDTLAARLWIAPQVRHAADEIFAVVRTGHTGWGSISGHYGFGKTAATITFWDYARKNDFLAIPPLACTSFDELASGIASLACAEMPKARKRIEKLFKNICADSLERIARNDSQRFGMSPQKMRQFLNEKLNTGQLILDNNSHRLVEFLSKLGELATDWSNGLIVILDELQQLLGPLDARSIIKFREFVWGMRTEQSHTGVVISLDSLLEARLSRWAGDVLHRIRENGISLQLAHMYTRDFPNWLWEKLISHNGQSPVSREALTQDVLTSLGQFVERPDLANGPRTVIDVFAKATAYYEETGISYDVLDMIEDVYQGHFRYFGEGAPIQSLLAQFLSDQWILESQERKTLLKTLAAFPLGCSEATLERLIPNKQKLKRAKVELYNSLLVNLSDGLALEPLQQVRRPSANWEQLMSRCWETLPAMDALVAHTPDMLRRALVPRLFPKGNPSNPAWERNSNDAGASLTGWTIYTGSFDDSYPQREIALYISSKEPDYFPPDVDLCIAMICDADPKALASAKLDGEKIIFRLPMLKPLTETLPAEIARYHKYIQPEPFRAATILAAIYELETFLDKDASGDSENGPAIKRVEAFVEIAANFIIQDILQGMVDVGLEYPIRQRGAGLLRAMFTAACRYRFPKYETLIRTAKWQEFLHIYRRALSNDLLNKNRRQGREDLVMAKAEIFERLFEQPSTAAGDSFIRMLGALIKISGNPKLYSISFMLHPAEIDLLNYLRSIRRAHFEACAQFLRHQGYIQSEAEEIVSLLESRGLILKDKNNRLRLVQKESLMREFLVKRIRDTIKQIRLLGADEELLQVEPKASLIELQKRLDEAETLLQEKIERQVGELDEKAQALRKMIGIVMASEIPETWAESDLKLHLVGIANMLLRTKKELLSGLRKELQRVEEELGAANQSTMEWAVSWQRRKGSYSKVWQKLEERVTQFEVRVTALNLWFPYNSQLRSVQNLSEKVKKTDPAPALILSQLIGDFRQRFALSAWEPVFEAEKFAKRLQVIQTEIQSLLYRYAQAFNEELGMLRENFKDILPASTPPAFDVSQKSGDKYTSIQESFQQIYRWAIDGFQSAIANYRYLKQEGKMRHASPNSRKKWSELDRQIDEALRAASKTLDFEATKKLGNKITKILQGFVFTENDTFGSKVYDDPQSPPDFKRLEELFLKGQIVIQINPKGG